MNTTLLGNSQTFFGVLATLVILCIFHDGNNFIYRALREIFVSLKAKVPEVGKELNEIAKQIDNNDEIRKLKKLIVDKGTDFYHIKSVKLLSKGVTLVDNIELMDMKTRSRQKEYEKAVKHWRTFNPGNSESLLSSLDNNLFILICQVKVQLLIVIKFTTVNRYFYRPAPFSSVFISNALFLVALPVKLETCTYRVG